MPSWNIKITGIAPLIESWEEGGDITPIRDSVVSKVKDAVGYVEGDDLALDEALDELSEASTREEFDFAMNELYDWADKERVWIDPVD
jgi:hypothetical protein